MCFCLSEGVRDDDIWYDKEWKSVCNRRCFGVQILAFGCIVLGV